MKIYIIVAILSEKLLKPGLSEVVFSKIVLGIPTTRVIKKYNSKYYKPICRCIVILSNS